MKTRRYAILAGLALGPVLVLVVFFVLPVTGMLAAGASASTARFDPGGVAEVLARPRTHRVLWFTVWSAGAGDAGQRACSGCPRRTCCTGCAFPAAACVRALLLVPFVLPTVVVGVAFRQLLGESGPLGLPRARRDRRSRSSPAWCSSTSPS